MSDLEVTLISKLYYRTHVIYYLWIYNWKQATTCDIE